MNIAQEMSIEEIDQTDLDYLPESLDYLGVNNYWPFTENTYDAGKAACYSIRRGGVLPEWTQTAADCFLFSGTGVDRERGELTFKYGYQSSQTLVARAKEGVDFYRALLSLQRWVSARSCSFEQKNATVILAFYKWFDDVTEETSAERQAAHG